MGEKMPLCLCPDDCGNMRPTELNQNSKKTSHQCLRYGKQLFHGMFHPHLMRIEVCRETAEKDQQIAAARDALKKIRGKTCTMGIEYGDSEVHKIAVDALAMLGE